MSKPWLYPKRSYGFDITGAYNFNCSPILSSQYFFYIPNKDFSNQQHWLRWKVVSAIFFFLKLIRLEDSTHEVYK